MTPSQQLHHASGVLSRVLTLRVALNGPAALYTRDAFSPLGRVILRWA
jgi:hypothetical protein